MSATCNYQFNSGFCIRVSKRDDVRRVETCCVWGAMTFMCVHVSSSVLQSPCLDVFMFIYACPSSLQDPSKKIIKKLIVLTVC